MPASKAEQVLDALKALLETVPDAVGRAQQRAAREDPGRRADHPARR